VGTPISRQALDFRPGAGRTCSGVRIGEIDYNHCTGTLLREVRTDELDLRDLIKAGILVGIPLVLILKQPDLGQRLF